jgi:hypothetical protein
MKELREQYIRPEKGWRVAIRETDTIVEWDGAEWKELPKLNLTYMITRVARDFGWSLNEILDMTFSELQAVLEQSERLSLEGAYYTALAFNDPQKICDSLEEIHDRNLTDAERWDKARLKWKEVEKGWHSKRGRSQRN